MPMRPAHIGLILTGGGARAAYQVGVLKAIRELLNQPRDNPFAILCGTSAGAINAARLAVHADHFSNAVSDMINAWEYMQVADVYRADVKHIMRSGAHWLAALTLFARRAPVSLLDNAPLARMLESTLDAARIQQHIDAGRLHALAVTASGYGSGQSVSFFQAPKHLTGWRRKQRVGLPVQLGAAHLLASAALPFLFPAVKLDQEYFGDGSMRQIAPISPALHLGAERLLIIGTAQPQDSRPTPEYPVYPSLAQIAGHALNSIFLDTLQVDLERLERINRTVDLIPAERQSNEGMPLRRVKTLFLSPSVSIEHMASRFVHALPRSIRFLLQPTGALDRAGGTLASYLLFEAPFCRALIDLGVEDTMARANEVRAFFSATDPSFS